MVAQTHSSVRLNISLTFIPWTVMLAVSILPNALFHELTAAIPDWLTWAKIGVLVLMAAATFFWKDIRSLRNFFIIQLGIFVAEEGVEWLQASAPWQAWRYAGASFAVSMLGTQLGRLIVSLIMISLMLALGYRRANFFLVRGKFDAPIEPVKWLGFPKADPWTRFGGQWSFYIALGVAVFLIIFGRPSWPSFIQAPPLFPAVLLFAAMNAFNEEMTYRSTMLASLEPAIGSRQALWNAALFFGLSHYFGVPYGVIGVIMASFLGWMLGKAMIETRGFFWAWFIHFVQDVLIFSFMAVGSIRPAR
jgi:hypothetical protein